MAVEEVENTTRTGGETATTTTEAAAATAAPATEATATGVGTLAATRYAVHPDYRVNVRSGPGTNYQLVRVLQYGASVPINCQKPGERIAGPYGTTNLWDNIANGEFISDAYVYTGSSGYVAPRCA
ncbi:SH3 domain-containing protein [Streptomyces sp. NPDC088124]|uniref:SH3 domain-containing protein n=1 Tax=Streptomyces sp. NPDC088124 TaxID=3154654 RepID=UPI00341630A6